MILYDMADMALCRLGPGNSFCAQAVEQLGQFYIIVGN